jgi:hypothetical protein
MASEVALEQAPDMGRKKSERETTLVRTYKEFAERLKQASGERGITAAEFCERFLMPCMEKAHSDYINAEARKIAEAKEKKGKH